MRTPKQLEADVLENAAIMLHILGNPHRLQICALLLSSELCVNSLAEMLGDHPNAVSQHLNMMKAIGLLKAVRRGKHVYYRVVDKRIPCVLDCLRESCGGSRNK